MLRLLSLSLFLICVFSIESKGDINKTLSRINVAHTVSDTVEIFFKFPFELTSGEIEGIQRFAKRNKNRTIVEDLYDDAMIIQVVNNRFNTKTLEMWNFSDGDQLIRMFKTKRKWLKLFRLTN